MNEYEKLSSRTRGKNYRLSLKLQEIREELLTEAMSCMIRRCIDPYDDYNKQEKEIVYDLTNNLIHENGGVYKTLSKYRTKSYALSECTKIVNKYYSILENKAKDSSDPDIFTIDIDTKTKFYKELEGMDMEQAEEIIAKRVRNNTYDYIKSNTIAKETISDIIDATKAKTDELQDKRAGSRLKMNTLGEAASLKNQVIEKLGINTSVYGIVVKNMAKNAYIDDRIKSLVTNKDNKIDFNLVEKNAELFYSFLETANGLKMADINKDNIDKYMKLK